jgi:hypothetical protein
MPYVKFNEAASSSQQRGLLLAALASASSLKSHLYLIKL